MFKFYPKLLYKVDEYDYFKVSDINFYSKIRDYVLSFGLTNGRPYTIKDGEAPSLVSYKLYGTTRYDYGLLILNDIRNIYDEWPRTEKSFNEYIELKYGSVSAAKSTGAKYYRSDGKKVSQEKWLQLTDGGKYYETNYDYEIKLNDEKAKIKTLDYNLMISFEVELRQMTSRLVAEEINRAA